MLNNLNLAPFGTVVSFYDDKSAELPVSATFIIASNGQVMFAESEGGDYRKRTEPKKILEALKAI